MMCPPGDGDVRMAGRQIGDAIEHSNPFQQDEGEALPDEQLLDVLGDVSRCQAPMDELVTGQ